MPKLEIRDLSLNYAARGGIVHALSHVDLEMHGGDFVVALGASGCGKTTLLNCIAGLLLPSHGTISLDGRQVTGPGADRGVVFQKHALMPWLSVRDNVAFGLRMRGADRATRARVALEKLDLVGTIEVRAPGYETTTVSNIQVMAGQSVIHDVALAPYAGDASCPATAC